MGSVYQTHSPIDIPMGGGWPQPSQTINAKPKHVSFELLLEGPHSRARLPMRVNIWPHDTTESIVATVKNFHGIYDGQGYGVSFEDRHGNTLIARYENFEHNMTVFVRRIPQDIDDFNPTPRQSLSPRKTRLDEPFQMLPPQLLSRPSSRSARNRSMSPDNQRGRRSLSRSTNRKSRSRPGFKSRATSSHGSLADLNGDYSDSEAGEGSVTSSRKDNVASAEISLDNIVEGGRRKRAKFDSSELPLFAPPQVPVTASISSVSPQRRISSNNDVSPYSYSNQQTFSYTHPLPSPQSHGDVSYVQGFPMGTPYATSSGQPHGHRPRTRGTGQGIPRNSYGGVLPTPDPTIGGSVISDEDVALQLMRLGDASNFSSHGRHSTSTIDDALSGKAELASSDECSDDGSDVDEFPAYTESLGSAIHTHDHGLHRYDSADESDEYDDRDSFRGDSDDIVPDDTGMGRPKAMKKRAGSLVTKLSTKAVKSRAHGFKSKVKTPTVAKAPISPTSLPPASRKTSSASLSMPTFAPDEEDLSTKPRCQRCRKSKKGCDRQRPCQRCKDAGIGIDGCVSEDEGNGRKGRYGRHMGVPVKKIIPDAPTFHETASAMGSTGGYSALTAAADKNKKRKR
ncbi:putative transcriptional regulatory protein C56F2.05c [Lasiodiplodia hormozganensis]|uniref:Transcriptional regulatory protein C56F2.05c n=1 Tax=Lasiodiplodia hormozganensis TaxID=869390 RepID=A0AA39YW21_9PEZI|nr:putative transcriptional regulatory protein C56F2.05c [Lasiodiplodia hormozganensis]